jgi:pilus assembly protein CpaD
MRSISPLHVISLAAAMLAGSCSEPDNFVVNPSVYSDGAANHPITVTPAYRTLKVGISAEGLSPDDGIQLSHFVSAYLSGGNGTLSISAPNWPRSSEAIESIADRIVAMGVPRSRLLVGTRDVTGSDERVEIGYVSYSAQTAPCGNWTQDGDDTGNNLPLPDFGCSVEHNIAAMVADPRDLAAPRDMGPGDAVRRATLTKQYETGQTTSSQKTQDQSGAVSQVGSASGSSQ